MNRQTGKQVKRERERVCVKERKDGGVGIFIPLKLTLNTDTFDNPLMVTPPFSDSFTCLLTSLHIIDTSLLHLVPCLLLLDVDFDFLEVY